MEIDLVYSENHRKEINTLCGQNTGLLNIEVVSTHIYHCAYRGVPVTETVLTVDSS
jgi:hypothetical protein